jgi:putative peptidoglycan lipid II flippase
VTPPDAKTHVDRLATIDRELASDGLSLTSMAASPSPPRDALSAAVRVVSGVTMLSRLGGLARDVMLSRLFGAGPIASAFMAGFTIPNTFRRLFGEGALTAAFIPEYTRALKADPGAPAPREADRLASLVVTLLLAATGLLTAILELGMLIALLTLDHIPERMLAIGLIMVMLPFMPLICVAATLAGMLQVHGRFGPASSGPLLLNGFIIAVGLYALLTGQLADATTAYVLGVATVLSGLTQCLWYARLLRPHARWSRDFAGLSPRIRAISKAFVPALIGLGTLQLMTLIETGLAMWPILVGPTMLGQAYPLDQASNSLLGYAQRLYQFPLGVFGIAVATAIFPMLSRAAGQRHQFEPMLRRGIRLSLFIGLPASLGLWLVREPLTAVLYSGGSHGLPPDMLARASAILGGYAPAIWAYSLNHVFTRAFYATGDTKTPMRVSILVLLGGLILSLALIWPLHEAGLAWSSSIAAVTQCLVMGWLARRLMRGMPAFGDAQSVPMPLSPALIKIALATALMGGVVFAVLWLVPADGTWRRQSLRLALGVALGGGAYLLAARALRCQELRWLLMRS